MSGQSAIEWTDATWNPVRGCTKVSAGCKNCYAETFAERWRGLPGHPYEQGFDLRLVPEALAKPLTWRRGRRVFVNSMSDLFHEEVPFEYVAAVFGVMAACPQHTFLILTKRPERMLEFFKVYADDPRMWAWWCLNAASNILRDSPEFMGWRAGVPERLEQAGWRPLANVQLGVSTENQETADLRIPILMKCPAAVRFISAEPLLAPVVLKDEWTADFGLDWVIVGGESGRGARPCAIEWVRNLVNQCTAGGLPVFVKQLGAEPTDVVPVALSPEGGPGWAIAGGGAVPVRLRLKSARGGDPAEWPSDLRVRQYPAVGL